MSVRYLATLPTDHEDLFASPSMVQLADDAEGGIRYWPRFINIDVARTWFECLLAQAAWSHWQWPMYDHVVDVPRLLASYALDAVPDELPLADLLVRVQDRAPAPCIHVGLNLYRDGRARSSRTSTASRRPDGNSRRG